MSASLKQKLTKLLGSTAVRTDAETIDEHSRDKWFASSPPEVVVFAESTEQVSRLMKFASRNNVPVTARGAGSATSAVACRRTAASRSRSRR